MQDLAAYNEENSITNIKAPVGGVISNTNLAVGDFVNAGESLANIVTSDSLQIQYQLPSQDIGKIHLGQKVYFYPDGQNKSYLGKVTYISPQLNNSDYSVDIRANLANFSGLTPNYFGKVIQVVDKNYQTLSIPQGFVYTDAKGFYVYILKDNKVTTKYFKAGSLTQSGMLQVKSGLMPNELIITSDPSGLNVGQKVQVES